MTFKEWWKKQEIDDTEVWNESSEYAAELIWEAATQAERERCMMEVRIVGQNYAIHHPQEGVVNKCLEAIRKGGVDE